MNYLLDLFTPETWRAFQEKRGECHRVSAAAQSAGKRPSKARGDIFICYLDSPVSLVWRTES